MRYEPGSDNKVIDALSRLPPIAHVTHLSAPTILDVQVIWEEVEKDVKLVVIIEQLKNDDDSVLQYFFQQGIFMYKGRLVMSKTSKLILAILHTYHDSVFGSHSGFLHTYEPLTRELN